MRSRNGTRICYDIIRFMYVKSCDLFLILTFRNFFARKFQTICYRQANHYHSFFVYRMNSSIFFKIVDNPLLKHTKHVA